MERRAKGEKPQNPLCIEDLAKAFAAENILKTYGTVNDAPFYDCVETQTATNSRGEKDDYSYGVFSIKHVTEKIKQCIPPHRLNILVDATFSIVPKNLPFTQILILNTRFFGQVFPFAFVLMTHKSEPSYTAVFQYIHNNVMSLECATVTSDYETAMRTHFVQSAKM